MKNARGHTPLDLATTQATRDLIQKALNTTKCSGNGSKFDFKNVRYYCEACTKFFSEKCCWRGYYFETKDSEKKERPVCFCNWCLSDIEKAEKSLREAID